MHVGTPNVGRIYGASERRKLLSFGLASQSEVALYYEKKIFFCQYYGTAAHTTKSHGGLQFFCGEPVRSDESMSRRH